MQSSFVVVGEPDQLSVKYTNLYVIDKCLTYVTTSQDVQLPVIHKWTNTYHWTPVVKKFDDVESLNAFITNIPFRSIELAVLGDIEWYGNIAHALFDGIYPSYLALVKFGMQDRKYTPLVNDMSNTKTLAYEVINTFSGAHPVMEYPRFTAEDHLHFEELVAGTGQTGNRIMNQEYTLYGDKYDGIAHFKRRMLEVYDTPRDLPLGNPIKIVVIDNKRYSANERKVLNQMIEIFKQGENFEIEMVDWSKYPTFKEQMELVATIDIQVTGPGTGMLYMPFMKRGSVNINLGYMEHTQTNTSRPNIFIKDCVADNFIFPGWMEQAVCSSVNDVSSLYYDRTQFNELELISLVSIIGQAVGLIKAKKILPVKHHTDALVFKEYCKRSGHGKEIAEYLTGMAFFIELFVNEHPLAIPPYTNLELLRSIKTELGFSRNYEYPGVTHESN